MKLSDQAMGTIMMLLQKAIITQCDVTDTLRELNFTVSEEEKLEVINPPTFEIPAAFLDQINQTGTTGSD